MPELLHDLLVQQAAVRPDAIAVSQGPLSLSYAALEEQVRAVAQGLLKLGLSGSERVAVYLPKRLETVSALFSIARAGGVFVPINPLLKADQVAYILSHCSVRVLLTSHDRLLALEPALESCHDLRSVVLVDAPEDVTLRQTHRDCLSWSELTAEKAVLPTVRRIDKDMAAILYTSGSTGKPKGVVLSHRNLLSGAASVAQYLGNHSQDSLLAVLPLSFDAGFSQLSTAFSVGARVVLMEYLLARDVLNQVVLEGITGMTAVPTLWIQLAAMEWPEEAQSRLRYVANTGGAMPGAVVAGLRRVLPRTQVFLMYGLTEAFRSTYLPPAELDRRPDSIGKAVPNAEVLVVREDGSLCAVGEPGELVHRGATVALGYWNDPQSTGLRFRPAPNQPAGLPLPELAVWSGDTVRMDEDGFLYFVGRRDDMIKSSGYRISPTEVEEVLYASGLVDEAVALGVPHPLLGQAVVTVVKPGQETLDTAELVGYCRRRLPGFMVPVRVVCRTSLPRNPNGKFDRRQLLDELRQMFANSSV
ncbi:MAG: acyl-CoA ligase (AMP-forming), exosortase A system-associated [Gammaproteobacteria bacterium]|nr:acyl-CoA ligase (AMP-forming), exosortase A system-associated [Gammaproteobacteria bacterium]MCP5425228.1 acyl-CoA ligase (AMP-forming), exosortase A system-associated [Gammaproteobacteria bacterium]MCP5459618.1 acyl-CoA ligase (AMP-forming), exosortase A system-associated [Gammaproteobacteria bacterium]